jgi:hypothetical protein
LYGVVKTIAEKSGFALRPEGPRFLRAARRLAVQVRHWRLF